MVVNVLSEQKPRNIWKCLAFLVASNYGNKVSCQKLQDRLISVLPNSAQLAFKGLKLVINSKPCNYIFFNFSTPLASFERRPLGVCWCKSLNGAQVSTSCQVIVLQHPHEEKRCLRTAPILEALLPQENYLKFKGKKFNPSRFPNLIEIVRRSNSILLYPGEGACDLKDMAPVSSTQAPYNIFILDGTWQQAKSIFNRNPYLREMKQVRLSGQHISQYVIRTQPTEDALSTVESAAIALSSLERNWSIYSLLIDPLKLICKYQMNHGAVKHHSKEFLILSGRYEKPLGKRTFKKLQKCGVRTRDFTAEQNYSTTTPSKDQNSSEQDDVEKRVLLETNVNNLQDVEEKTWIDSGVVCKNGEKNQQKDVYRTNVKGDSIRETPPSDKNDVSLIISDESR